MKKLIFLVLLVFSFELMAAEMGRLFFTPAEREKLNNLRANAKSVDLTEISAPDAPAIVTPPSDVSVQGYVKRSDGKKNTVWVNGQPVQENSSGAGVEVGRLQGNSNQVPLTLSGSGKSVNLKAGQTYNPNNDQVSEVKASKKPESESDNSEKGQISSDPLPPDVLEKIRELKRK